MLIEDADDFEEDGCIELLARSKPAGCALLFKERTLEDDLPDPVDAKPGTASPTLRIMLSKLASATLPLVSEPIGF